MPRYRFGTFTIDTDGFELIGPEGVRDVEPQVFEVLRYLVEQPGRLVTKEELLDNVWGDRFVSESALTTRIKQVRRALDDDGRTQWAVKTVHGRGYRFVAERDELAPVVALHEPRPDPAPVAPALPTELLVDARRRFVGRTAELDHAVEVVQRTAGSTDFGWVWLLGEPGIGKTRLAAEVARAAQQRGHRVLFGRNNEDLRVPHQPFIELIRSAFADLEPDQRVEAIAAISPELAPLLPDADASREPAPAVPHQGDDATRRYRLFEAMADWLLDAASSTPVTVIIDDVHWAADSTLQLLSHLQKRAEGGPVTFVLTARDTAPDVNARVLDMLGVAQGMARTAVLRLGGLSGDDAATLVGASVELDEVMRQTAGNPLLLQAVNPADGSVDIGGAVHRRLASLEEAVQETLQTSSVIGLEFDLQVAAVATGRDELDLLDDLEQAIAARLLDDVGADRFRFTHALIRSSLREELSSARRARMHKRIADAIVEVFAGAYDQVPALAFHTAAAAEADPKLRPLAIERLELAAEVSTSQLSFDEAAASLERARRLTDPDDATTYARLTLEQGTAQNRGGATVTAAGTFAEAVSAARSSGDPGQRIEAALGFEESTWRAGLSGLQALEYLDEATEVLDALDAAGETIADEAALRARLAIGRLRSFAFTGQVEEAEASFASTLEAARALGSVDLEAMVLSVYLGQIRFFRGFSGTQPLIERLEELQPRIEDGDLALHAALVRVLHALLAGRFDQVRDLARLMATLQEHSYSPFWESVRTNQEAMEALYLGDLQAAETLAEQCLALTEDLPQQDGSGTYGLRMFVIRREQDRLAAMAPLVRRVLAQSDAGGIWTPGLALLLCETGAPDEAAAIVADIKDAGFDLPVDALWSTVMVLLAETMVHLGDLDACAVLRERLEPLAGANAITGPGLLCFGSVDRYLGMLSLTLGDLEAAEEHLGAALEADSAFDSVLWANESRLWLSRVRRAQGHEAEADAMVAVVADQAGAAGLARLERLALAELGR